MRTGNNNQMDSGFVGIHVGQGTTAIQPYEKNVCLSFSFMYQALRVLITSACHEVFWLKIVSRLCGRPHLEQHLLKPCLWICD